MSTGTMTRELNQEWQRNKDCPFCGGEKTVCPGWRCKYADGKRVPQRYWCSEDSEHCCECEDEEWQDPGPGWDISEIMR